MSRAPAIDISFNNTAANRGPSAIRYRALMLGERTANAPIPALTPTNVTSSKQVGELFGMGSMLHHMAESWFANNTTTELCIIAQTGVANNPYLLDKITFTGTATEAGTIALYIGGIRYAVPVAKGEDPNKLTPRAADAIRAASSTPPLLSASASANVVELRTSHSPGVMAGLDIRFNYHAGETFPPGVTATAGLGEAPPWSLTYPDLGDTIRAMGDTQYNIIINPYQDQTNIDRLRVELDRRWRGSVQREGVAIMARLGSQPELVTWANKINSQLFTTLGIKSSPTPAFKIAAAYAAVIAREGEINPARPFQTLGLQGVMAPLEVDRYSGADIDQLLHGGVSPATVAPGNIVTLTRVITMYQKNAGGTVDPSYLDLNTIQTLAYIRSDLNTMIAQKFPRSLLGSDGGNYGAGLEIVTPMVLKSEILARFRQWEELGLVENFEQFKKELMVRQDLVDKNCINVEALPDLINQFIRANITIKFLI